MDNLRFQRYFKEKILDCTDLNHIGNNRLFQIKVKDQDYLLKIYSTFQTDSWNRGKTEFYSLSVLNKKGFNVPRPISYHPSDNIAIYTFEKGKILDSHEIDKEDIQEVSRFISKLHKLDNLDKIQFPLERTNCLNVQAYINLIKDRYNIILNNFSGGEDERFFLEKEVLPQILRIEKATLLRCKNPLKVLTLEEQAVNPGDFGFNNLLVDNSSRPKKYVFHDFEYCGRDDPIKQVLDFIHHDRTRDIRPELKSLFLDEYLAMVKPSNNFDSRIRLLDPLVGMNWLMIYLNVLNKNYSKHLQDSVNGDYKRLLSERVSKAKDKLNNLSFFKENI